jgi:acetyl esterase/lipase
VNTVFLALSILGLAFTVNAWRPMRSIWLSIPVFFAGWLTAELAPLLLAIHLGVVAWFIAAGALEGWQGWTGLGVSAAVAAALIAIIAEAMRGRHVIEDALRTGLGEDYRTLLSDRPAERLRWKHLLFPLWLVDRRVKRHRSIPYGPVKRRNLLDVYTGAHTPGGAPVLLYIHGGAWVNVSNKNHQGKPLMLHMVEHGWVCVAANYRLSPRATFPDHLVDVKRAIAWIHDHIATYGGDPSVVVVAGGSAGAHLAALAALTQSDPEYQPGFEDADTSVAACIPSYGVYDFTPDAANPVFASKRMAFLERVIMKARYADDPEPFRKASPHHLVRAGMPPFFVIHGGNDRLAPVEEARAFVARLREPGDQPVVYAELARAHHAFDVFHSIRTTHVVHAIERFCEWVRASDTVTPPPSRERPEARSS